MSEEKPERIHISITPKEVWEIDEYRFTARISSRPETIRHLVFLPLEGRLPSDHLSVIEIIKAVTVPIFDDATGVERVHVPFHAAELEEIDNYRFTARHESRSDAIRALINLSLSGALRDEHLLTLKQMRNHPLKKVQIHSRLQMGPG